MAREVANLLPAPAALPRTRQTRRDYSSLAEGPINTELLKNVAAETRKRRASASSSSDSDEPLVKRPRGRPPKNPLPPTVPVPSGTSEDTGISPQFLMGVAAEAPKGRTSTTFSGGSTELPAIRKRGRPRKTPFRPTSPPLSETSEDKRISPQLLTDAAAVQTRKGRVTVTSSGDPGELPAKRRPGRPRKTPLPPTVPAPTDMSKDMGVSPQFQMGAAAAQTRKGRASSPSSSDCTEPLAKRRPGQPRKIPAGSAASTVSKNKHVRTQLLKAAVAADMRQMRALAPSTSSDDTAATVEPPAKRLRSTAHENPLPPAATATTGKAEGVYLDIPTEAVLAEEQEWADSFQSFLSSVSASSSQPDSPGASSVNGPLDTHMSDLVGFNLSGEPVEDSSSSEEVAGLFLAVVDQGRLEIARQARAAQKPTALGVRKGQAKKGHGRRRRS
ncbi:g12428 [Coccomyxa viridis]|uniref:G12428 protein n=1 Tax=Coccomyxa viridis TaxID=1274662 RepID=A0ABP1GAC0_9CHLO